MSAVTPAAAAAAAVSGKGDAGRRARRRRRWVAAVVAAAVVAGAGVAAEALSRTGSPVPAGPSYPTSTAMVTRRSLTSQIPVNATLAAGGSYSVVNQAQGTLTWLPAAGQVVRQGQVLYRVSGSPVVLLYGTVPAYRSLSAGMTGQDVAELNHDLVALGYADRAEVAALGWHYFSWETRYALENLQSHLGLTQTGTLPLGQAVFLPARAQITGAATGVVPGGTAQPGATILSATSTVPVVTIGLDPAEQTYVKDGDKVTITLPDGATTPGIISSVGTVASAASSGGSATITVLVTPADPTAVAGLTSAPVTVAITTGSVSNALVVPVDALLAQPGGGYAVEEVTAAGRHRLVPVSAGLFDDADGLVQVSGAGLAAGQRVVVPGT